MAANKKVVSFGAVVGMTIGGSLPMLFGDYNIFDTWSMLGGLVGGIGGIAVTIWLSNRFG